MNTVLTDWYFIRHAPAGKSNKGLYPDQDVDAILPAKEVIQSMANILPENALWFVSPLSRTKKTADALRKQIKCSDDVNYEGSLKEQDFGDWQGLSFDDLWQEIKGLKAHNWSYLAADTRPPKGESFIDVRKRVKTFLDQTICCEPSRPRIIVTHAGIIRAFIGLMLELKPDQALSFKIDTFSVSKILHQTETGVGGAWQVQYLNQSFDERLDFEN